MLGNPVDREVGYDVFIDLGDVARKLKDFDNAEQIYKERLKWWQQVNDPLWIAIIQVKLGIIAFENGDYKKAFELYKGTNIDQLINKIRGMHKPDEEVIIQSNKSLLNISGEVFDRTFLITHVLQTLAIIVAFIGVLSTLMAIQLERNREFGVLRATGLTPKQLWKLVILQTGIMDLIAGLISVPIGNILALVLIEVINERSFGWTIQFEFMLDLFLQAIILEIVAAVLAGIYPAFKMAKTSPALALREE